jgi:trk system potassium uptake protein TrkH
VHFSIAAKILGVLLSLFSTTLLVPLTVAVLANDETVTGFAYAFALTLGSGLLLWLPFLGRRRELRIRDGFLVTSLFWTTLGLYGALPFALTESLNIGASDAIFESISGLTTTGATVLTGLDDMPASILLYRQLLQWLGGIGIIVIAVAILPMLGIGGMQLYRTEIPGPSKDSKLTPRITETAKALFAVYLSLTLLCGLAYYAAGMSAFDALCHAFSTVAIGGFSTHDASMGFFQSNTILLICSLFMLISGISFSMHYIAWSRRNPAVYPRDSETRFYLNAIAVCTVITCTFLYASHTLDMGDSLVHGLFQTISIITTAGFATQDFSAWPLFLPIMLIMFSFMGGCVGSTGGGIKAMRLMLIYKQGLRELRQLVHPHAVIPLKVGNRRVEASVISAVWSFFAVYTFIFIVLMLAIMATGIDFLTAFSAMAASLNNLGPGLGEVAANYAGLNAPAKSILCLAMLLGRLEIFTLLVIFTPTFWRQ